LVPYGLSAPGGLWLLIFFLIPMITMLSLSTQTCDPITLACTPTWHFAEFGDVLSQYHVEFLRSLAYGGIATLIDLAVAFPVAYWIAFRGGEKKNFFLLMLLLPFFVSFVIRTLAWKFILSEELARAAAGLPRAGDLDGRHRRHRLQLPAVHRPAPLRRPRADRPARPGGVS
jgi:spermidine/putrescine transport system permease protein